MLFSSYEFVFVFLPITLGVVYLLGRLSLPTAAMVFLVTASLFFYAWWNPPYLILLLGSIGFNFAVGRLMTRYADFANRSIKRNLLTFGVVINLAALAYFKYAGFFVDTLMDQWDLGFNELHVVLPLAISFFTFQQITFLVGVYRDEFQESSILRYGLFVSFFPQLIAGPIVHYREMRPQYLSRSCFDIRRRNLAVGSTIFIVGLFKKVVVADGVAVYANPVFEAANAGIVISFVEAWTGALAYTLQLYFDFSGYSDMAVGLAYLFGFKLALNFYSPYKASSMIEFWRRWHITLSRFLRDYLYFPLGGNRQGSFNRYRNLLITMLLGGLWHGAGWTFVAWGGLHGLYLAGNHLWRALHRKLALGPGSSVTRFAGWAVTFIAVVFAWVLFRAENFDGAVAIYEGMVGQNGIQLPRSYFGYLNALFPLGELLAGWGVRFAPDASLFGGLFQLTVLGILILVVRFAPNLADWMGHESPALDTTAVVQGPTRQSKLAWRPTIPTAIVVVALFLIATFRMDGTIEFLYFQF